MELSSRKEKLIKMIEILENFSRKRRHFLINYNRHKAPIPKRPSGWVYDPNGNGFIDTPIEVQGILEMLYLF